MEGNEKEDCVQRKALAAFIDTFVSCSLTDPSIVNTTTQNPVKSMAHLVGLDFQGFLAWKQSYQFLLM